MPSPEIPCHEQCPYQDQPDFAALAAECCGPRIRIDTQTFVMDKGKVVGELAKAACGSRAGPDRDIPTISIQDWMDTTLTITELKALYDRGALPDQSA